jgi:hypothetical protein
MDFIHKNRGKTHYVARYVDFFSQSANSKETTQKQISEVSIRDELKQ